MNRLWVCLILLGLLFASTNGTDGNVGFGAECVNNKCHVEASASMWALSGSLLIAAFAIWFPRRRFTISTARPVLIWQRIGAMFIDFMIVLSVLSPVVTLPVLLAEARYTGNFAWSFERDFARDTDFTLTVPLIFIGFAAFFLYHFLHIKYRVQTIGQYIAGYVVQGNTEPGSRPAFGLRVFLAWVGLCMWPVSLHYALKREDKLFWWDNATDTRATWVTLQKA